MSRLKLVLPTEADEQKIWDYRQEFLENGEHLNGTNGLGRAASFQEWLQKVLAARTGQPASSSAVLRSTFLAVRREDGKLVGMIDIRHRLDEGLLRHGGHIGYSVRKSCRCQGYATEMLALGLEECRRLGIDKALITCYKSNIGSAKTIQNNGGVLENELLQDGIILQRYWIDLIK